MENNAISREQIISLLSEKEHKDGLHIDTVVEKLMLFESEGLVKELANKENNKFK